MEKFRSRDGTLIAYERTGTGEPLVLVHGSGGDHTRWTPVLPALARRFAVYGIDRRGRGESGDSPDYSLDKVVAGRGRLRLLAAVPAATLIGVPLLHEAAVGVLILAAVADGGCGDSRSAHAHGCAGRAHVAVAWAGAMKFDYLSLLTHHVAALP